MQHWNITILSSSIVSNAMHSKSGSSENSVTFFYLERIKVYYCQLIIFRSKLRIHHTLTQLNPNHNYAVHVMLTLNNISLPYDKLLINTRSKCAYGVNFYETNGDSHIIPNDIM